MKHIGTALAIGVCLLVVGSTAADTIVYDTLGSDDTYDSGGDWIGNLFGDWVVLAENFVPSGSGDVVQIDAAIWWGGEGVNEFTLRLLDDAGGYPGNTILWEETFTNECGGYGSVVYLSGLTGPAITAGTSYWLYCEVPEDGQSVVYWYSNNKGHIGGHARKSRGYDWNVWWDYPNRAFRVIVADASDCPGDLDGDGTTGQSDLGILLADWGCAGDCVGDLNGDGTTGQPDLGILLADWGCGL